jgi:hypothetical protein
MNKLISAMALIVLLFTACKKETKKDTVGPTTSTGTVGSTTSPVNHCDLSAASNLSTTQDSVSIHLTWDTVTNATGYNIYRLSVNAYWDSLSALHTTDTTLWYEDLSLDAESAVNYKKIGTCESPDYKDLSPDDYNEYYYKIIPFCSSGSGPFSESVYSYFTVSMPYDSTGFPTGPEPDQDQTKALFDQLAQATGGESYTCPGGSTIHTVTDNIIQNHCSAGTDIVFLVDNTGSMGDDIDGVKDAINNLISLLPSNCMVGAAYYRDKNVDTDWYGYSQISSDLTQTSTFVNSFYANGGGDTPESVYDGIYNAVTNINWRPNATRIIIVIGDAAPLTDPSTTQHSFDDVKNLCISASVNANLYPVLTKYYNTGGSSLRKASKRGFHN